MAILSLQVELDTECNHDAQQLRELMDRVAPLSKARMHGED